MTIAHNLQKIHERISSAAQKCDRDPKKISLVAVSKTKSVSQIEEIIDAGHLAFGENYVQEAIEKMLALAHHPQLEWHFIGALQSNKTRAIAGHFSWCHTVDTIKLAQRLHLQRPQHLPPLNVLIQININEEPTKAGILLQNLIPLADAISPLSSLRLRGLMAIPAPEKCYDNQIATGKRLFDAFETLKKRYCSVDTFSFGMSEDLEAAIVSGSTLLRIGSAIFGAREK